MLAKSEHDYSNTCAYLNKVIQDLDVRIRVSEKNKELKASYENKVKELEENIELCNGVNNILRPMLHDVHDYIADRRKNAMYNINNALRISGEVIPDADADVHFQIDGEDAWISTSDGLEVDMVEGGGFRQVSSAFIRSVVLDSNPDSLNTLLLDEVFSKVDSENSARLSTFLNVMCQTMQIISIEQKQVVYGNVDHVTYVFKKNDDYAEVSKHSVTRGDIVELEEETD